MADRNTPHRRESSMNTATHIHLKRNPSRQVGPPKRKEPELANTTESIKANVRDFYDLAFNKRKPAEAVAKHVGSVYRQHNPGAADGAEAFVEFVTGFTQAYPALRVDFKRFVAEGDLVTVHSQFVREPNDRGMAVIDIFRLEDGKIVEHWDSTQEVPAEAANSNTLF
jgi:predicted SnoaL-like aldol condensation-catalyzing enzyme